MSATEAVISARLKKSSETPSPSSTSRSRWSEAKRPPRVEERRHEEQAERQPDVGRVDLLGDRALVAAGELGLDLVVAPGLVDLAAAAVDDHLGDLARRPASK